MHHIAFTGTEISLCGDGTLRPLLDYHMGRGWLDRATGQLVESKGMQLCAACAAEHSRILRVEQARFEIGIYLEPRILRGLDALDLCRRLCVPEYLEVYIGRTLSGCPIAPLWAMVDEAFARGRFGPEELRQTCRIDLDVIEPTDVVMSRPGMLGLAETSPARILELWLRMEVRLQASEWDAEEEPAGLESWDGVVNDQVVDELEG